MNVGILATEDQIQPRNDLQIVRNRLYIVENKFFELHMEK